jgi:hypothetical protein
MRLNPPSIAIFLVALTLAFLALITEIGLLGVPHYLPHQEFWLAITACITLMVGNLVRSRLSVSDSPGAARLTREWACGRGRSRPRGRPPAASPATLLFPPLSPLCASRWDRPCRSAPNPGT